jgi:hypothetical protein
MGFLNSSQTFTRFRIVDAVPAALWPTIPDRLKRFAFVDIDDSAEERSWGWTEFADMLDTQWNAAPPEKGDYLAFAFRLDTRRIPAGVLKKHTLAAMREEEARMREQGKKYIARARKLEVREQVKLRLRQRFLPVPAVFEVVWATRDNLVYLTSTNNNLLDLFQEYFTRSFDLRLEALSPYALAAGILDEPAMTRLDVLEPTRFV